MKTISKIHPTSDHFRKNIIFQFEWTMLVFALSIFLSPPHAEAHHPSGAVGGNAGPIVTIPATTLSPGQTVIGVTFDYLKLENLSNATLEAAALSDQDVHGLGTIQSTSLSIAYGVIDNLTIALKMPWLKRTGILEGELHDGEVEIENLGDATGFGDLTLLAQYRLINSVARAFSLAVIGGVKLPTGDTDKFADGEAHLLEAEFQPGSGSVDWLLGLALSQRIGLISLDGNVLYFLVDEGTQNTDLGDRFQLNLAASMRVFGEPPHIDEPGSPVHGHQPAGASVDLVLELNGEWDDRQEINGETDIHSGGRVLFVSPGVRFTQGNWSGFASAGLPVMNDLNGIQSEPEWRLLVGASVALP